VTSTPDPASTRGRSAVLGAAAGRIQNLVHNPMTTTNGKWRGLAAACVALMALAIYGCDDLLTESPVGDLTAENFFQNGDDAEAAINGSYEVLHSLYHSFDVFTLMLLPTPQYTGIYPTQANHARGCYDVLECDSSSPGLTDMWQPSYSGINQVNSVIANVPAVETMDPVRRDRIIGEAKFLRALHYFNLVRLFGGVPLRTEPTTGLANLAQPRATADEIYNLIIQDLTEAQQVLPPSYPASDFGRATQGAAQALLGKVYLQRGVIGQENPFGDPLYWPTAQPNDLQSAITEFRKVVDSQQYNLVEDYGELFGDGDHDEQNAEVIFSIQNLLVAGLGGDATRWLAPVNSPWGRANNALGAAELPFWESYAEDDERRDVTWLTEYVDRSGNLRSMDPDNQTGDTYPGIGPHAVKWVPQRNDIGDHFANPNDTPLLRYADVLLSLAEAINHMQGPTPEAVGYLNEVRDRAGLDAIEPATQEEMHEALYWERNWELATEFHAWFDGQRFWELYKDHMNSNIQTALNNPTKYVIDTAPSVLVEFDEPAVRLFPIPLTALDRNPELEPTPGHI
jgi:starch-binding outer membrane protein, SusD/RagB family